MPSEVPLATYRLQLSPECGFEAAASLVPYLKALGISHLYASPFLKARPDSPHGYDIVDHTKLNPQFGGEQAFAKLSAALSRADLGLILDFVPNHMGVGGADNAWWLDVLEFGPKSPRAAAFDIDWQTLPYRREGGVLLPLLGAPYGDVLERGDIKLRFDGQQGSFSAWYYNHRLPIRPENYSELLRTLVRAAAAGEQMVGRRLLELAEEYCGPHQPSYQEAPQLKSALKAVVGGADVIARGLVAYEPSPSDPRRAHALHRLLERQHYRLAHWRIASSEINYRRFFDINDLAGIRIEEGETFARVHSLVATLVEQGQLHGLRLDHIDGLKDPIQYCRRLQRLLERVRPAPQARPFYVVVEKILAEGESMPSFPGAAGTTGYEWLNLISRSLLDRSGLQSLKRLRCERTTQDGSFAEVVCRAKKHVLNTMLSSEFTVLSRLLTRIAAGQWHTRDYTVDRLRAALKLFILEFPVYRTYVTTAGASAADRATIGQAIAGARARWFGPDSAIFDFLQDVLTLDLIAKPNSGYSVARVRRFTFKLQQFTGPMMAKSVEDTAFYRFVELLALNEVGGDPAHPELAIEELHRRMADRSLRGDHGLTATATHDTKRGEDARMRILALSDLAGEWGTQVGEWKAYNQHLINVGRGMRAPSSTHEYLLYQALIGAWPLEGPDETFISRIEAYAIKAAREAKLETSWLNPDERYEARLTEFVRGLFDQVKSVRFAASFDAFARRVALIGALNSLAQLVLKAMMPGVPDFYQGTEFWDLSLVDPDNRRPVDFAARSAGLAATAAMNWQALVAAWPDGRIKLALMTRLLALRAELASLFTDGAYDPIEVTGPDREHVIAFLRSDRMDAVVVAVGRHFGRVTGGGRHWPSPGAWDAELHLDQFRSLADVLCPERILPSGRVAVSRLFQTLPFAVLSTVHDRPAKPRNPNGACGTHLP
jgi:(1->4)-alpha-D-glucan 1-alpha-D-glucosylmutase